MDAGFLFSQYTHLRKVRKNKKPDDDFTLTIINEAVEAVLHENNLEKINRILWQVSAGILPFNILKNY